MQQFRTLCQITTCLLWLPLAALAQQPGVTFAIEKLSPPKGPMWEVPTDVIRHRLGIVEKTSPLPDSLVWQGMPVLGGFMQAYKEHRPIVLSPDMVWLLISQGFARHIVNNPEEFRQELVGFQGKQTLTVKVTDVYLGDPQANWEQVFPQFTQQIAGYTGPELLQTLTGDFTTTTPTTRIASQITVMEAMKPYFDYKVMMLACGLPSVTLEGTPADWQRVLDKTRALTRYRLGWWTRELEPVLREFVKTAEGHGSHRFWMNMVKVHTEKYYGAPNVINGWLVKFYPYTKKGQRTGFKPISSFRDLPDESVEVPFKYVFQPTGEVTPMAFWAGFVGLRQDKATYALRPEIAWAVLNKKEPARSELAQLAEPLGILELASTDGQMDELTVGNLTEVPAYVLKFRVIDTLRLSFVHNIVLPDELSQVRIGKLYLNGQLNPAAEPALLAQFPRTAVYINGVQRSRP